MPNDNRLGFLLYGFIAILIGIILLETLADTISTLDDTYEITNESIAISVTSVTVVNETITMVSQEGNVIFGGVSDLSYFGNVTNNTGLPGIVIGAEVNYTRSGRVIVSATQNFGFPADGEYNVTYTYEIDSTGTTKNDDLIGVAFFGSGNISTHTTGIEVNDEVNFTYAGVIAVSALNFTADDYNITYTYEDDNYVANGTTRTLINTTLIFFALFILLIGIIMVRQGFKELF